MPLDLPAPVAAYFAANPALDVDGMLAPFAADAVVFDEKRTRRGRDEIRAWIEEATVAACAVAVPQDANVQDGDHVVTAEVSGTFPGSPVTLDFRFALAHDRIARLAIS